VGGDLIIYKNASLSSLSGLSSLNQVGGDLYIYVNINLCQSLVEALIDALGAGLAGEILDIYDGETTDNKDC
jgi:hypothetical protein